LFIVLRTAQLIDDQLKCGEMHLFVGEHFLVSVRHGDSPRLSRVRERCEAMPQQLAKGPGYVLHAIMDYLVDMYFPVIEHLQRRFDALEAEVFGNNPDQETIIEGLYQLKRELLELEASISPITDIANEILRVSNGLIPKEVRVYFRDIADHAKRIERSIDDMREMLLAAMQVHLTYITIRQNEVVKGLAGWGAILAVPTMVFSWYGMNSLGNTAIPRPWPSSPSPRSGCIGA
jgi:magnesium transporter